MSLPNSGVGTGVEKTDQKKPFFKNKKFQKNKPRLGKNGKPISKDGPRRTISKHFGKKFVSDGMVAAYTKLKEKLGGMVPALIYLKVLHRINIYKKAEFKHISEFRYTMLPHIPYDLFGINMKFLVESKYLLIQKMRDTIIIKPMQGNGKKLDIRKWKKAWYLDPAGIKRKEYKERLKAEQEQKEAAEKAEATQSQTVSEVCAETGNKEAKENITPVVEEKKEEEKEEEKEEGKEKKEGNNIQPSGPAEEVVVKRKRGRPRKIIQQELVETVPVSNK